jgi:hypothetical protein
MAPTSGFVPRIMLENWLRIAIVLLVVRPSLGVPLIVLRF